MELPERSYGYGKSDGASEGDAEGIVLGARVGCKLGVDEGALLGAELGSALGSALGLGLGAALGTELGIFDGVELGSGLGIVLGPALGEALSGRIETLMYVVVLSSAVSKSPFVPASVSLFGASPSLYPVAASVEIASTLIPSSSRKSPIIPGKGTNMIPGAPLTPPLSIYVCKLVSLSVAVAPVTSTKYTPFPGSSVTVTNDEFANERVPIGLPGLPPTIGTVKINDNVSELSLSAHPSIVISRGACAVSRREMFFALISGLSALAWTVTS
jgi:hypothetical protein